MRIAAFIFFVAAFFAPVPSQDQTVDRMRVMADSALAYCRGKGMNEEFCVLVDMKAHSGRQRFYVWDFAAGKPSLSSLCAHGCGGGSTGAQPVFSNTPGSNCTSLGRYRIGARSWSRWGINVHYKLHGLDPTNDKAYERIVVLHSHTPMPGGDVYPRHLPMGWSLGCPVISDTVMRSLDAKLQKAGKPVLLWIFY